MPAPTRQGILMSFPLPLDRTRILRRGAACEKCRKSRTKCDGARPECSTCVQRGRRCTYEPSSDNVQDLEKRVRDLEAEVRRASQVGSSNQAIASQSSRPAERSNPRSPPYKSRPSPIPSIQSVSNPSQAPNLTLRPFYPPPLSGLGFATPDFSYWIPNTDMPFSLRSHILTIFMALQPQFSLDLYMPRLRDLVYRPPTNTDLFGCGPTLWNAICLVVTGCSGPESLQLQQNFLDQVRYYGERDLASAAQFGDHPITSTLLEEYITATVLEIHYLLRSGRLDETLAKASALVRFSLGCGLHLISDPFLRPNGLLGPPRDALHAAERINLWWSVYVVAQRVAFLSGSHDAIPDFPPQKIDTVLPRPYDEVIKLGFGAWRRKSTLRDFFNSEGTGFDVGNDHLLLLSVKSLALFNRVAFHTSGAIERKLTEYRTLCTISNHMLGSVPHIDDTRGTTPPRSSLLGAVADGPIVLRPVQRNFNPSIVQIHIELLRGALILGSAPYNQLGDSGLIDGFGQSMDTRLRAARALGQIAGNLTDISRIYVQFSLAPPIMAAMDTLVFDTQQFAIHQDEARFMDAWQNISNILQFLPQLAGFFPEIDGRIASTQQLLGM